MSLTLAIARDEPVGVVIAAWSGRLSQMYRWDLTTDTLTPGQFLKARASVLAISHDAKHVVYYAEAFNKREQAYVAVSHLPYFTALVFQSQFHCGARAADFAEDGSLDLFVMTYGFPWVRNRAHFVRDRIDPGCPFEIRLHTRRDWVFNRLGPTGEDRHVADDPPRSRTVHTRGLDLVEKRGNKEPRVLRSFPKEEFQEVPPPDWATRW